MVCCAHRHRPSRGHLFHKGRYAANAPPGAALDQALRAQWFSVPPCGYSSRAGGRPGLVRDLRPCHSIGVEAMNPVTATSAGSCRSPSPQPRASDHPAAGLSPKGAVPIRHLRSSPPLPEDRSPESSSRVLDRLAHDRTSCASCQRSRGIRTTSGSSGKGPQLSGITERWYARSQRAEVLTDPQGSAAVSSSPRKRGPSMGPRFRGMTEGSELPPVGMTPQGPFRLPRKPPTTERHIRSARRSNLDVRQPCAVRHHQMATISVGTAGPFRFGSLAMHPETSPSVGICRARSLP